MARSLDEINRLEPEAFVAYFGGVFEHSPWVAEGVVALRPFASPAALLDAMAAVVRSAPEAQRLALIRAHPDLAGKAALAGELTQESTGEQAGAGLDRLTPDEYARFATLNGGYQTKFGFPFVMAVKGADKHAILAVFVTRLEHDPKTEAARAIEEIVKIGGFRLHDLVAG